MLPLNQKTMVSPSPSIDQSDLTSQSSPVLLKPGLVALDLQDLIEASSQLCEAGALTASIEDKTML